MSRERELDRLLGLINEQVEPERCLEIDARYKRTLACEEVDRPPVVIQALYPTNMELPSPWSGFRRYTYKEGFDDPMAMMQNELLSSVAPGMLLEDDSPAAVRNNHGTIQIASLLGGHWEVPENDFPWVKRFESSGSIREIAVSDAPVDLCGGILKRSFATLDFYGEKLGEYAACKEVIQVALPDLQGPMDTAEQLWGSDIYYAFTDDHDLLSRILARVVDVMVKVSAEFRRRGSERLDPVANTQHGYVIPGRLLIRNDSAIMLSPETYGEFVQPHDARLLREVGGGSIHFCGNGEQLIEPMLRIPDLRGIDMSQSHLMNLRKIYEQCLEHRVAITGIPMAREELVSGRARANFPTGCVFIYKTNDFEDAREVMRAYEEVT